MFTPNLWKFRRFSDAAAEMLRLQREMNRLFSNAGHRTPQDYPAVKNLGKYGEHYWHCGVTGN